MDKEFEDLIVDMFNHSYIDFLVSDSGDEELEKSIKKVLESRGVLYG